MSNGDDGPDSGEWAAETLAAGGTHADGPATVRPPPALLERGEQLGRYLVMERLGAGAMGVVYAAYDPELDRKVAVKLLRGGGQAEAQARLRREAQALAKLSHPAVVGVHDVGEVDGRVFVAMEFVAGITLRQWLDEGPHPWTEVCDVFVQAGAGLAAAHDESVVHRDFKPDNVLLSSKGRVCVADFGIALELEPFGPSESVVATMESHGVGGPSDRNDRRADLTASGSVMGTPLYMAPEQWKGLPATAQSDQFSFCVALFEALHGKRPFHGESLGEIATAIVAGRIEVPSRDHVPPWLDRVVRRGLSNRPADRFEDMRSLVAELTRDPAIRRRRVAGTVLAAGGLCGALLLGRSFASGSGSEVMDCSRAARSVEDTWNPDGAAALREAFRATGSTFAGPAADAVVVELDEYAARWAASSRETCERFRVEHQDSERLHDLRRACLDRAHSELASLSELLLEADVALVGEAQVAAQSLVDVGRCSDTTTLAETGVEPPPPELAGAVEAVRRDLDGAKTRIRAGKYTAALERAQKAEAVASGIGYMPLDAETALVFGEALYWTGDYDRAVESLRRAVDLGARCDDADVEARGWTWLVWVVGYAQHRLDPGLEIANAAESAIVRAREDPSLRADLLDYKGMILLEAGDLEAAAPSLSRALALREEVHGPLDHRVIWSLNNLSVLEAERGNLTEAIALQMRALPMRVQLHGPSHPDVGFGHKNLGTYHHEAGALEKALDHDLQAVALFESGLGSEHPQSIEARHQLAQVYRDLGRHDIARRTFDQALDSARAIRHPRTEEIERERAALETSPRRDK